VLAPLLGPEGVLVGGGGSRRGGIWGVRNGARGGSFRGGSCFSSQVGGLSGRSTFGLSAILNVLWLLQPNGTTRAPADFSARFGRSIAEVAVN
jgi:hypothetical protein